MATQAAVSKEQKPSMHDVERLATDLANVLANPACPEMLSKFIGDGLSEIENQADTLSPTFLSGLFQAPRKGGAA